MKAQDDKDFAFDPALATLNWWRGLNGLRDGQTQSGQSQTSKDRATLARLRRASLSEAMTEEETLRLFRALRYRNPARLPRTATLAVVILTLRDNDSRGRQIGRDNIDAQDSAALKPGRFKRLLDATTEGEIAAVFRRAIAILGGAANVKNVARLILAFENEEVRRRLIFDYYAAGAREADQDAA